MKVMETTINDFVHDWDVLTYEAAIKFKKDNYTHVRYEGKLMTAEIVGEIVYIREEVKND